MISNGLKPEGFMSEQITEEDITDNTLILTMSEESLSLIHIYLAIGITAVSYLSTFFPVLNDPVPAGIACIATVSYTHLDVYKRQELSLEGHSEEQNYRHHRTILNQFSVRILSCQTPVSYTHLDVYKRQIHALPPQATSAVYSHIRGENRSEQAQKHAQQTFGCLLYTSSSSPTVLYAYLLPLQSILLGYVNKPICY